MALLDIFKKGKKKGVKEIKEEKAPRPTEKKEKKEEKITPEKQIKSVPAAGYQILRSPHITEKATDLAEKGQYVFKVWPRANKTEIKKAIERKFGVLVSKVRISQVKPKSRRVGGHEGCKKGYKKAVVVLKGGQKIEIMPK